MKWHKITESLPEPERPVFAMCNINGGQVAIRACWIPDKSKEDEGDYEGDSVYDEAQDKYFWPEGWYEWNLCEEAHFFVDFPITHWLEITGPEDCCTWTYDDYEGFYDRSCCFEPFSITNDDGLKKNSMNHCPNCGREIKEVKQ